MVTEIRLESHNGLHLAHIGRWMRPEMIVIVTSRYADPVLARDAKDVRATFLKKPLIADDLMAALHRAPQPRLPGDLGAGSPPAVRARRGVRNRSDARVGASGV